MAGGREIRRCRFHRRKVWGHEAKLGDGEVHFKSLWVFYAFPWFSQVLLQLGDLLFLALLNLGIEVHLAVFLAV